MKAIQDDVIINLENIISVEQVGADIMFYTESSLHSKFTYSTQERAKLNFSILWLAIRNGLESVDLSEVKKEIPKHQGRDLTDALDEYWLKNKGGGIR